MATTPVFLPGKSHGQRSLAGYSTWGHQESDTTKAIEHARTHLLFSGALHSVQSGHLLCHVRLFVTPWTAAHQATLPITNSWSWLKLMSIESVIPSNHLIFCRPLLLPPSTFPNIRVFSKELSLRIRWPKDWSFSISPSNEYSE